MKKRTKKIKISEEMCQKISEHTSKMLEEALEQIPEVKTLNQIESDVNYFARCLENDLNNLAEEIEENCISKEQIQNKLTQYKDMLVSHYKDMFGGYVIDWKK